MLTVIIGMLLALVLAAVVLALVAVPARREGRDVLTSQGEQIVHQARERTAGAVGAARERVGDLAERLPVGRGESPETAPETIDLRDAPTRVAARARSSRRR
ncbi:MAG TPA: hypothetical protein VFL94_17365 [Actinomycetales bacterium]|nr:hypothetical protein [Actinomycetales bacterium]